MKEALVKFFTNRWTWIVIGLIMLVAITYMYVNRSNKAGFLKLPNGGKGLPDNWSPATDVISLHDAMAGFGTDEQTIYTIVENRTDDQLVAIYNEFLHQYGDTLFTWFEDDLSGDDLHRAMAPFSNLQLQN